MAFWTTLAEQLWAARTLFVVLAYLVTVALVPARRSRWTTTTCVPRARCSSAT